MAAELYAPTGGANRKLKEMYAASGGANRKMKEMYAVSGGANRKIFTGADAEVTISVVAGGSITPTMLTNGSGSITSPWGFTYYDYKVTYSIKLPEPKSCIVGQAVFQMGRYWNQLGYDVSRADINTYAVVGATRTLIAKDNLFGYKRNGEWVTSFTSPADKAFSDCDTWDVEFDFRGRNNDDDGTLKINWSAGGWTVLGQQLNNVDVTYL